MSQLDLSEYLSDDTLTLTGIPSVAHPAAEGGGSYVIPSLSAEDGARLQQFLRPVAAPGKDATAKQRLAYGKAVTASAAALEAFIGDTGEDEDGGVSLQRKLFGTAYDQMIADGVTHNAMTKLTQVVITQVASGLEMAERVVANAVGEAKARQTRATSTPDSASTSSGKAPSKSSPASSGSATRATRKRTSSSARSTSAAPSKKQARKTA